MNARKTPSHTLASELGVLLRYWRDKRGKSQMELALDTGISQRHLSFIENGRSAPSRQMLMNIAEGLDLPFRDRNRLLLATGFAPTYAEDALDAREMQSVTVALERLLHHHEPFPAMVMDRYWNVVMTNASAPRFFNCFIDLAAWPKPRNMLHLMFDPAGMRPFIANWENTQKALIQRVRREAIGCIVDERTEALLAALLAYPDLRDAPHAADRAIHEASSPVIPLSFNQAGHTLNYFSMVTTVGTPQTISAQELRLECMFPLDELTEARHRQLLGSTADPG